MTSSARTPLTKYCTRIHGLDAQEDKMSSTRDVRSDVVTSLTLLASVPTLQVASVFW